MGALKDIAVYLALHSFKEDWKYNTPHIVETLGTSRNIVAKYLALLQKIDVLRPVEETSCRNVKYYILNRPQYVALFETEPEDAANSPLLQALQLHCGRAGKTNNQLHYTSAVSCPSLVQSVALQNDSVELGQCNSISRYKVDEESRKKHTDSVCVLSNSFSEPANPNADQFGSTDANRSSADLATEEPGPADQAHLANASNSVALFNRFASTNQPESANGSLFSSPDQSAKVKADQFLAHVKECNEYDEGFALPKNLAELAANYFLANPSKSAYYLIAVLNSVANFTCNLQPAEDGYDRFFNIRRSHNLAFFFKCLNPLINEINLLISELNLFTLEETAAEELAALQT